MTQPRKSAKTKQICNDKKLSPKRMKQALKAIGKGKKVKWL